MDIELAEDQLLFQQTVRNFLQRRGSTDWTRQLHDSGTGFDPQWWESAAALGCSSLLASEEHGGGSLSGRPLCDATIIAEEIGRVVAAGPFLPVNIVATAIDSFGSDEQKRRYLPQLLDGTLVAAWAASETAAQWHHDRFSTRCRRETDEIVLSGAKAYVEAGDVANLFLVVAREGDTLRQVLVPRETPGLEIAADRSIDLVRRFARLEFRDVRLPHDAVLGYADDAAGEIERLLELSLTLQTAESVGLMDRVFELTLDYMGDRYAFGRPIASYQALKHRVADMLLQLETAKATSFQAAAAIDDGDREAPRLTRVAAAYVKAIAATFIQECVQLLGGIGVTWEHDIHIFLRRATLNRAILGTPEDLREQICELLTTRGL